MLCFLAEFFKYPRLHTILNIACFPINTIF